MKMLPTFDAIAKFYMSLQNEFDFVCVNSTLSVWNVVNNQSDVWTFDKNLQVWIFTD